MESESTSGVTRRKRGSFRYYPYHTGKSSAKKEMKKEVVGLGVELSLSVAESMFLLCDDIPTMLLLCHRLLRYTMPSSSPVLQRLLLVIHHVYSKHIEPKKDNDNNNNSAQWELIKTTWRDFTNGVIVLHRLVWILGHKDSKTFDDRLLSTAIAKYKQQVLKKIEDTFSSVKDVSEANGFVRETIKSNIYDFWKSLFVAGEITTEEMRNEIVSEVFPSVLLGESLHREEVQSLPIISPYILGTDFAKEELKEEAVKLGVELSLYIAESMFLLCDDIRSVLRFCFKLWRYSMEEDLKPVSTMANKLLCVIHYLYTKHIKPKNGVYKTGGESVQLELIKTTLSNFEVSIKDLNTLVSDLTKLGNSLNGRECTSRVEDALKKVDEKLKCVKDVSKANGFSRDDDYTMKSNILVLWKSLFDKETEEPFAQKVIRDDMLSQLFPHLSKG